MDDSIMNAEQAVEFLGISEKTLIKLLREEHIPARKIGREWRFCKEALVRWISQGDSLDYINRNEKYQVSNDEAGGTPELFDRLGQMLGLLKKRPRINQLLKLDKDVEIPAEATLRVSYKQQRDIEKLEFKIYWPLRNEAEMAGPNQTGERIRPVQGELS